MLSIVVLLIVGCTSSARAPATPRPSGRDSNLKALLLGSTRPDPNCSESATDGGLATSGRHNDAGTPEDLQSADATLDRIASHAERLRCMLKTAKSEKDLLRLNCVNDKLTETEKAGANAQARRHALEEALTTGDPKKVEHEKEILGVLETIANRLDVEAQQCIGEMVSAAPLITLWDVLAEKQTEAPGYGLYSYVITLQKPTDGSRERTLLRMLVSKTDAAGKAQDPSDVNVTYVPVNAAASMPTSDIPNWIAEHYDAERALQLARKAAAPLDGRGPYIISSKKPLLVEGKGDKLAVLDLSAVPADKMGDWVGCFIKVVAQGKALDQPADYLYERFSTELFKVGQVVELVSKTMKDSTLISWYGKK
jgi:hypothetical protein